MAVFMMNFQKIFRKAFIPKQLRTDASMILTKYCKTINYVIQFL